MKAVKKLGVPTIKVRAPGTHGQAMLAVSLKGAETIRKHYAWRIET